MSLIRRAWLLLFCTLLLTFGGGVAIHVASTNELLQTRSLPKHGTVTGAPRYAPAWFAEWVSNGTDKPASGEPARGNDDAIDELWHSSLRFTAGLALLCLAAGGLAAFAVSRLHAPLAATLAQAESLERGDYLTAAVPTVPELRRLTKAMNSMVARLRGIFDAQAVQVDSLRRQASCDPLTGLSNRGHFLAQLGAALIREDASAAGGMVLLRVLRLAEMNRSLGREDVDHLILAVGRTLQAYIAHVRGAFVGRLNGSDFALVLPESGMSMETSEAVVNLLKVEMPIFSPQGAVVAGAVEIIPGCAVADLLADADMALARAENAGPFAVMSAGEQGGPAWWRIGEHGWGERVRQALDQGRVRLGSFPLVDAEGQLIHLECPLRLQLEPNGAYETAGRWLPLATRSRLTGSVDERALALALEAIARDGQPRCINISPASLTDSGFAARLRKRLQESSRAARHLWIEIAEAAADEQFDVMRELARQLRPTGARFGIEHAGERLGSIQRLFESGLDYVKLDAAFTRGVATNADRANFVQGLVRMLHSLSLLVFGEGIVDEADATKLWECGVDGLTGPWFSEQVDVES